MSSDNKKRPLANLLRGVLFVVELEGIEPKSWNPYGYYVLRFRFPWGHRKVTSKQIHFSFKEHGKTT